MSEFEAFEVQEHEFLLYLTARWLPNLIRAQIDLIRDLIDTNPRALSPILGPKIGRLQDLINDLDRRLDFLRSEVLRTRGFRFE
jgi:hypothetical protein